MANYTLTTIEPVNLSTARTVEIPFTTGHTVGDILTAAGAEVSGITNVHLGIVIRAGNAAGNRTLVLVEGEVEHTAAHGLAAGAIIYSDGDNTASDAEPAGAAGTRITELGVALSTTRSYIKVTGYEKGA